MIKITTSSYNSVGITPSQVKSIEYDFYKSSDNTLVKSYSFNPILTTKLDDPIENIIDDTDLPVDDYKIKVSYTYDGYQYDNSSIDSVGNLTSDILEWSRPFYIDIKYATNTHSGDLMVQGNYILGTDPDTLIFTENEYGSSNICPQINQFRVGLSEFPQYDVTPEIYYFQILSLNDLISNAPEKVDRNDQPNNDLFKYIAGEPDLDPETDGGYYSGNTFNTVKLTRIDTGDYVIGVPFGYSVLPIDETKSKYINSIYVTNNCQSQYNNFLFPKEELDLNPVRFKLEKVPRQETLKFKAKLNIKEIEQESVSGVMGICYNEPYPIGSADENYSVVKNYIDIANDAGLTEKGYCTAEQIYSIVWSSSADLTMLMIMFNIQNPKDEVSINQFNSYTKVSPIILTRLDTNKSITTYSGQMQWIAKYDYGKPIEEQNGNGMLYFYSDIEYSDVSSDFLTVDDNLKEIEFELSYDFDKDITTM